MLQARLPARARCPATCARVATAAHLVGLEVGVGALALHGRDEDIVGITALGGAEIAHVGDERSRQARREDRRRRGCRIAADDLAELPQVARRVLDERCRRGPTRCERLALTEVRRELGALLSRGALLVLPEVEHLDRAGSGCRVADSVTPAAALATPSAAPATQPGAPATAPPPPAHKKDGSAQPSGRAAPLAAGLAHGAPPLPDPTPNLPPLVSLSLGSAPPHPPCRREGRGGDRPPPPASSPPPPAPRARCGAPRARQARRPRANANSLLGAKKPTFEK